MRRIRSMEELDAIREDAHGFLYNDFTKAGATAARDNVLHRASCPELAKMTSLSVGKLFFEPDEDAATWLEENRGPEGVPLAQMRSLRRRLRDGPARGRPAISGIERPMARRHRGIQSQHLPGARVA